MKTLVLTASAQLGQIIGLIIPVGILVILLGKH